MTYLENNQSRYEAIAEEFLRTYGREKRLSREQMAYRFEEIEQEFREFLEVMLLIDDLKRK